MSDSFTAQERAERISRNYTDGIVCLQEAANQAIGECAHTLPEELVPKLDEEISARLKKTIFEDPVPERPARACPALSDIPAATKENWQEYTDLVSLMYLHGEHNLTNYFTKARDQEQENKRMESNG